MTSFFLFFFFSFQFLMVLLDKWVAYKILDVESVITWVLGSKQSGLLCKSVMWDILHNAISKMTMRTSLLRTRIDELTQEYEEHPSDDVRYKLDRAKRMLTTSEKEQSQMFTTLMDRFVDLLSEHVEEGPSYDWAAGLFTDTCRKFCKDLGADSDRLQASVFDTSPKVVYDLFTTVRPLWTAEWLHE